MTPCATGSCTALEVKVDAKLDVIDTIAAAHAVAEATFGPNIQVKSYEFSGNVKDGKELILVHFEGGA